MAKTTKTDSTVSATSTTSTPTGSNGSAASTPNFSVDMGQFVDCWLAASSVADVVSAIADLQSGHTPKLSACVARANHLRRNDVPLPSLPGETVAGNSNKPDYAALRARISG